MKQPPPPNPIRALSVKGSNALAASTDFYAGALQELTAQGQQLEELLSRLQAENSALASILQLPRSNRPITPGIPTEHMGAWAVQWLSRNPPVVETPEATETTEPTEP